MPEQNWRNVSLSSIDYHIYFVQYIFSFTNGTELASDLSAYVRTNYQANKKKNYTHNNIQYAVCTVFCKTRPTSPCTHIFCTQYYCFVSFDFDFLFFDSMFVGVLMSGRARARFATNNARTNQLTKFNFDQWQQPSKYITIVAYQLCIHTYLLTSYKNCNSSRSTRTTDNNCFCSWNKKKLLFIFFWWNFSLFLAIFACLLFQFIVVFFFIRFWYFGWKISPHFTSQKKPFFYRSHSAQHKISAAFSLSRSSFCDSFFGYKTCKAFNVNVKFTWTTAWTTELQQKLSIIPFWW